jgi:hypothetical protein
MHETLARGDLCLCPSALAEPPGINQIGSSPTIECDTQGSLSVCCITRERWVKTQRRINGIASPKDLLHRTLGVHVKVVCLGEKLSIIGWLLIHLYKS